MWLLSPWWICVGALEKSILTGFGNWSVYRSPCRRLPSSPGSDPTALVIYLCYFVYWFERKNSYPGHWSIFTLLRAYLCCPESVGDLPFRMRWEKKCFNKYLPLLKLIENWTLSFITKRPSFIHFLSYCRNFALLRVSALFTWLTPAQCLVFLWKSKDFYCFSFRIKADTKHSLFSYL